jgi:hypothetical protein
VSAVTDNDSGHPAAAVTCYGCENNANEATSKAWAFGDLHCTDCHESGHRACATCGTCMGRPTRFGLVRDHRWDRFYCSSSCRVKAKRERDLQALERAAWEAEHPEEAAAQRAEWEAYGKTVGRMMQILGGLDGEKDPDIRAWEDEVRKHSDQCASIKEKTRCAARFNAGAVIYRRLGQASDAKVLPYCEDHACAAPKHNRDAPPVSYYPGCSCLDDDYGRRKWLEPEPCAHCGRVVRNHVDVDPRRFLGRWKTWMTEDDVRRNREFLEQVEALPEEDRQSALESFDGRIGVIIRTFCSESCRRAVFRVEAKAKRLAARGDLTRRCVDCNREFTPHRTDARYCSSACRQRAYRSRRKP